MNAAATPDSAAAADRLTCHVSDPLISGAQRRRTQRTRTDGRTEDGGPREVGTEEDTQPDAGRMDGRNAISARLSQSMGRPVLVVFLPFGVNFEMHSLLGHHRLLFSFL